MKIATLLYSLNWLTHSEVAIRLSHMGDATMATAHATDVQQPPMEGGSLVQQAQVPEIRLYSHSTLYYWWPVWAIGYVFALLTYIQGDKVTIGGQDFYMHPSKNLGVLYTVIFMLVILITNVSLRGLVSVIVIITALFFTVLFAWLGWWEHILALLPYLGIHMNLGFYIFFSTCLFIIWMLAFFVFDRMSYWLIRPGQMTHERVIGGGERSYDTRGLVFEKHLEDFFKHIILGLGSGDLRIATSGARAEEIYIPNVLFVHRKVKRIQELIAIKPDQNQEQILTAGAPG